MPALYHTVGAHGEVDVFPVQLSRQYLDVRFTGVAIPIKREETIVTVAVLGEIGDRFTFLLFVLFSLFGLLG